MIKRIVKMTFKKEEVDSFLKLFASVRPRILDFDGIDTLEFLRDAKHPHICFTISHWESEEHLNAYRNSKLFKETWKLTKTYFADRAEAWSLIQQSDIQ